MFKETLTVQNYGDRFHLLLYVEEYEAYMNSQQYNKTNKKMYRHGGDFFCVEVC